MRGPGGFAGVHEPRVRLRRSLPRISVGRVESRRDVVCLFARCAFARDTPAATMDAIADPRRVPYDDPFYADDARCPPNFGRFSRGASNAILRDARTRGNYWRRVVDPGRRIAAHGGRSSFACGATPRTARSPSTASVARRMRRTRRPRARARERGARASVTPVRDPVLRRRRARRGGRRPREFAAGEALVTQGTPRTRCTSCWRAPRSSCSNASS